MSFIQTPGTFVRPDKDVEVCWYGIKSSIINVNKKVTISNNQLPINKWSEKLNMLQKEGKYTSIIDQINIYLANFGEFLTTYGDSRDLSIYLSNITRWTKSSRTVIPKYQPLDYLPLRDAVAWIKIGDKIHKIKIKEKNSALSQAAIQHYQDYCDVDLIFRLAIVINQAGLIQELYQISEFNLRESLESQFGKDRDILFPHAHSEKIKPQKVINEIRKIIDVDQEIKCLIQDLTDTEEESSDKITL